jgi:hypothetical protein
MVVKTKKRALKTKKNMKGGWRISKIYTRTSSSKFHGVKKLSHNDKQKLHDHIKSKNQTITNIKAKQDYRNLKLQIYAQIKQSEQAKNTRNKRNKEQIIFDILSGK